MSYVFGIICLILMTLSLLLIFLSLPGNWIMIGLVALWSYVAGTTLGAKFFLLVLVLAAAGEVAEFFAGMYGTRKFGGSKKGSWGGIIGAIIGGILCAPILFGLGALPGALAGGFAGCFIVEKMQGMASKPALKAALGSTLGRFGGFLVKLAVGITILCLSVSKMWEVM